MSIKYMISSIIHSLLEALAPELEMSPGVMVRIPTADLIAVSQEANLGWNFALSAGQFPSGGTRKSADLVFYPFDSRIYSADRYKPTSKSLAMVAKLTSKETPSNVVLRIPEELVQNPAALARHLLAGTIAKEAERYLVSDLDVAFNYMDTINYRLRTYGDSIYVPIGLESAVVRSRSPKYLFMLSRRLRKRVSPELERVIATDARYWDSYSRLLGNV